MAYFAFSHLALILAFVCLGAFPHSAMGFFYHSWMMVPVHLVTLGWVSASILGALYMIAPMGLRSRLAESRLDQVAFGAYVCGLGGMLAHFWIAKYGGMLWSACGVLFAVLVVGWRTVAATGRAPMALGVRLHLGFAVLNFMGVALLGGVMGFAKIGRPLVGSPLSNLFAHFHLAAVGWVLMMVCGVAYRLMPMLIPAAVPRGAGPVASAVLLQAGVLGVSLSLLLGRPWLGVSSLLVLAGIGVFFTSVIWMLRNRRSRARGLPAIDYGLLHVAQAMLYLLLAVGLGSSFVFAPWSEAERLDWIPIYGILALLGFASQMILGVGARLFPLYAWLLALADGGFKTPPASPHGFVSSRLQAAVFWLWTVGVPCLLFGFLRQSPRWVAGASVLLGLAALGSAASFRRVFQQAHDAPAPD